MFGSKILLTYCFIFTFKKYTVFRQTVYRISVQKDDAYRSKKKLVTTGGGGYDSMFTREKIILLKCVFQQNAYLYKKTIISPLYYNYVFPYLFPPCNIKILKEGGKILNLKYTFLFFSYTKFLDKLSIYIFLNFKIQ